MAQPPDQGTSRRLQFPLALAFRLTLLLTSLVCDSRIIFVASQENVGKVSSETIQELREDGECQNNSLATPSCKSADDIHQQEDVPVIYNITNEKPYTVREFFYHYNCDSILATARPIHSKATWVKLRQAYVDVVGAEDSSIPVPVTSISGFHVPIYIDHSKETGRGIYVKERVAKDTLIWTSSGKGAQSASFDSIDKYREFLHRVDSELVCDLLVWCYPTAYEDEDDDEDEDENENDVEGENYDEYGHIGLEIGCDLDEGSFFNNAKTRNESNIYHLQKEDEENSEHDGAYALRNIEAGEQLLAWYDDFSTEGLWEKLGWENVWFGKDGVKFGTHWGN